MATDIPLKAKNAVVVEDDNLWQRNIYWALKKAGYNVTLFQTVDEALESKNMLREASVIVTDGDTKSNFNGLDLLRQMKDVGPGLVLFSGDQPSVDAAKEAGGPTTEALNKGHFKSPDTLVQLVRRAEEAARQRSASGDLPDM